MQIGVPRETKDGERRVALIPDGVRALAADGHRILVEADAGSASGFDDTAYRAAGAIVTHDSDDVWHCPLVVKVKEIQRSEFARLRAGTTIFCFAQLNRDPALRAAVLAAGVRIVAFETVRDAGGALPLLAPMSRIAGRLAPFAGARALQTDTGGNGTLLTGVDAVPAARVVILGAGNVGGEAARIAGRLGCRIDVFSRGDARLARLQRALANEAIAVSASAFRGDRAFDEAIADADLVIGAVLEPGRLSPKLIRRDHLRSMRRGSALVDVGIDQGGIAETSTMTSLSQPTYVEEGVVHYAVPNMPSLVARTATRVLAAAVLPYVCKLASQGVGGALVADPGLAEGAMVWDGEVVHAGLARDASLPLARPRWRGP